MEPSKRKSTHLPKTTITPQAEEQSTIGSDREIAQKDTGATSPMRKAQSRQLESTQKKHELTEDERSFLLNVKQSDIDHLSTTEQSYIKKQRDQLIEQESKVFTRFAIETAMKSLEAEMSQSAWAYNQNEASNAEPMRSRESIATEILDQLPAEDKLAIGEFIDSQGPKAVKFLFQSIQRVLPQKNENSNLLATADQQMLMDKITSLKKEGKQALIGERKDRTTPISQNEKQEVIHLLLKDLHASYNGKFHDIADAMKLSKMSTLEKIQFLDQMHPQEKQLIAEGLSMTAISTSIISLGDEDIEEYLSTFIELAKKEMEIYEKYQPENLSANQIRTFSKMSKNEINQLAEGSPFLAKHLHNLQRSEAIQKTNTMLTRLENLSISETIHLKANLSRHGDSFLEDLSEGISVVKEKLLELYAKPIDLKSLKTNEEKKLLLQYLSQNKEIAISALGGLDPRTLFTLRGILDNLRPSTDFEKIPEEKSIYDALLKTTPSDAKIKEAEIKLDRILAKNPQWQDKSFTSVIVFILHTNIFPELFSDKPDTPTPSSPKQSTVNEPSDLDDLDSLLDDMQETIKEGDENSTASSSEALQKSPITTFDYSELDDMLDDMNLDESTGSSSHALQRSSSDEQQGTSATVDYSELDDVLNGMI